MVIEDLSWEDVLKESFSCYLREGARSNKKLILPHYWIRENLKDYFDDSYEFYSYGVGESKYNKEYPVNGIAYDKKSDISIIKDDEVVGVVSFKFVSSNYSQNSNNYFENLLGECFNIQANDIPLCHILVMRDEIPYYKSNGDYEKLEKLKNHHLNKYFNILKLKGDYESIPKKLCINIIEISVNNNDVEILSPKKFMDFDKKSTNEQDELNEILDNMSVKIVDTYENCSDEIHQELKKMDIMKTLKEFADIVKS